MLRLDEAEVEALLPRLDLVALLAQTLAAAARGEGGGPVRTVLGTREELWFGAMPAWTDVPRPALGAKLVVFAPRNAARALPTHRAVVILFDVQTGAAQAWIEAEAITRDRTAAVSVAATQALAHRARGRHAILGAGVQGRAHANAFMRAGLATSFAIWSRTAEHAQALAADLRANGHDAQATAQPEEAVHGADVISTCTGSRTPLFAADVVADGAHINAVGACLPDRRELPGPLVASSALVVDDLDAAYKEAGDIILAAAEGSERWDGVVTLGAVLAGLAAPRKGRVSTFVSLGLGVEDVAVAAAVGDLNNTKVYVAKPSA